MRTRHQGAAPGGQGTLPQARDASWLERAGDHANSLANAVGRRYELPRLTAIAESGLGQS
jgi:hypothetical protein